MAATTYNIKFAGIELISKSLSEPTQPLEADHKFNFNFLTDIKVSPELKVVGVMTDVSISSLEGKEYGFFKIMCVFEMPNFDEVFTKVEENRYDTPIDLEILLKSVGISTIRGVIYSELRGTYLQGAIMPLIDMPSLIREQRKRAEEERANV